MLPSRKPDILFYLFFLPTLHPDLCPKPCLWRKSPPSKPRSWPRNARPSKLTWTMTSRWSRGASWTQRWTSPGTLSAESGSGGPGPPSSRAPGRSEPRPAQQIPTALTCNMTASLGFIKDSADKYELSLPVGSLFQLIMSSSSSGE